MALGTDHNSGTTLAPFIPEVWGEQINQYFKADLVAAAFFTDRSDELMDGGDTVHTPNTTAMSANTKTNGAQITLNNATETSVDLVVNTWKEVSFIIEDREVAQYKRSYSLQQRKAVEAAHEAAEDLEVAIMALFSGFSSTVGASTTDLADSEIRQAIATLATNKVTGMKQNGSWAQDVAFFLHPNTAWRQVQGIDKFSLLQNTAGSDPVLQGGIGFLYGIPVLVSPNVPNVSGSTGRYNALAHRDAIHWARLALPASGTSSVLGTEGVRVQTNYIPEYLGWLTTADICYGVIENRDNAGVAILTHATQA